MIEVKKLDAPLGAEIRGLDPRKPLDPAAVATVNRAFIDNLVIRIRDVPMSIPEVRDFSSQFGILRPHIAKNYRNSETPEVVVMTNQDANGNFDPVGAGRGVSWHVDGTFHQNPPKATLLHAVTLPDSGGNTGFSNMYMAYETMPAALKKQVDGRYAMHRLRGRKNNGAELVGAEALKKMADVMHPVIRQHPETGRKAVFVNPHHTLSIVGLPPDESEDLLNEICAWCSRDEFQWDQVWEANDTVMWENRSAWHIGRGGYPQNQLRRCYRTQLYEFGSNAA
jgi:taurine dioxygenase